MLLSEDVLLPNSVSVLRLLEQEKDGSLLYTCVSQTSQNTEIRLFQPATNNDTLLYAHRSGTEIVNGSLNPARNVIAFTTLDTHGARFSTGSNTSIPASEAYPTQLDHSERKQNWIFAGVGESVPATHLKTPMKVQDESSKKWARHCKPVRGKYVSYLADIHPTNWVRKFDLDQKHYQKVLFTGCNIARQMGDMQLLENRILLIMHRKSIGLYNILLKLDGKNEKMEIHSVLKAVMIVSRSFWSQWDPVLQRLYFLVVTKKKQKNGDNGSFFTYSTSLCCEQFSENQSHQQMFVCPLQLGIGSEILSHESSAYTILDMDSTVSDPNVNMRLVELANGTMCLCWQLLEDAREKGCEYKIAILTKDVILHSGASSPDRGGTPVSFCSLDNNVIVLCPGSFMHVLMVDTISNAADKFNRNCHYLVKNNPVKHPALVYQLPYPIPPLKNDCDPLVVSHKCFMLHQLDGKIISWRLCRDSAHAAFFDKTASVSNKIAIARLICLSFLDSGSSASFPHLQEVLQRFLSKDMRLSGDQILASMLMHTVASDVCSQYPFERRLSSLLPVAAPGTLPDCDFVISRLDSKQRIGKQISRGLDHDNALGPHWKTVCEAFNNGFLEHYCLGEVSEELEMLQKSSNLEHLADQRSQLQDRLSDLYENEIFGAYDSCDAEGEEENILNCFSSHERDHSCENNMALTYERLTDHLKQFIQEKELAKRYARSYVLAQLRMVNHTIALFLLVTKVDNHDQSLFDLVQPEERNLLQLLNHLLSACILINFPLPRGFQTFLTCLTFRCCLTTHRTNNEDLVAFDFSDSSESGTSLDSSALGLSYSAEDIQEFSFEFFQLVDSSCIHLTGEFVARVLEELPNHEYFGSFVHQMLQRTNFTHHSSPEGILQLWKHPHSTMLLAEMQSKRLDEMSLQPRHQDKSSKQKKSRTVAVDKPPTNFPPLDSFLDHVRRRASNCNADVGYIEEATLQNTITMHGKDALGHIAF